MKSRLSMIMILAAIGFVAIGQLQTIAQDDGELRVLTPEDERYHGIVTPSMQIVLVAPIDSILAKIFKKEGDRVKEGELVAQMDNGIQKLMVESARLTAESTAALKIAEVALEDAKLEVESLEDLKRKGAGNEKELRQARVIQKQREAELQRTKEQDQLNAATLKLEEERLLRYQITAPFNATVIDKIAEAGSSLARNDQIISLANLEILEARISLPVWLRGKLKIGQEYTLVPIKRDYGQLKAKLANIRPIDDPASDTFLCVFEIPNPDHKLPAGFTVALLWQN